MPTVTNAPVNPAAPEVSDAPLDVEAIAAPVFAAIADIPIRAGYLYDMDSDGLKEIIPLSGNCEADTILSVYACETAGARLPGSMAGAIARSLVPRTAG